MVLFSRIPEVVLAGKGKRFTLLIFFIFYVQLENFGIFQNLEKLCGMLEEKQSSHAGFVLMIPGVTTAWNKQGAHCIQQ